MPSILWWVWVLAFTLASQQGDGCPSLHLCARRDSSHHPPPPPPLHEQQTQAPSLRHDTYPPPPSPSFPPTHVDALLALRDRRHPVPPRSPPRRSLQAPPQHDLAGLVRVRGLHHRPRQQQWHPHHRQVQLPPLWTRLLRRGRHWTLQQRQGTFRLLRYILDPSLDIRDLLTGVSFASGAAGYDPLSSQLALVFSMSDQLDLFREYIGKIRAEVGVERARTIISESLYVVCTGSNDITNTYFSIPIRSSVYDIPSYAGFIAKLASEFLQELYGIGARRIGVLSLPPAGCLPSQRTIRGGSNRDCFEPANQLASLANSKIQSKIRSLGSNLPDAKIVFLDIYHPMMNIIRQPARYGFTHANVGCCGTGEIEVSILCNDFDDSRTCKDAEEYVFWDSFHPTEATYRFLVSHLLDKYTHEFY